MIKCPVSWKEVHFNESKAKAHLRLLARKFGYIGNVYPCLSCGGYHVGRLRKKLHINKYK